MGTKRHRIHAVDTGDEDMVRYLLAYLHDHPDALGKPEDILDFWITPQRHQVDMEGLHRVLGRLTTAGVLATVTVGDTIYYRRNPSASFGEGHGGPAPE